MRGEGQGNVTATAEILADPRQQPTIFASFELVIKLTKRFTIFRGQANVDVWAALFRGSFHGQTESFANKLRGTDLPA
jgi:hypothetical protein